jgi:GNAT superfamily N-acetyltransferase
MAEVERLLIASTVEVRECDPRHRDARFCLRTYYSELKVRFRGGYDPAVSPVADAEMTLPAGLLLVASLHGEPVGCGALIFYPDAVGLVKRMWVAPSVRGLGLGRRLLYELEDRARARGVLLMRLETRDELSEAIRMYERPAIAKGRSSTPSPTPTTGLKSRWRYHANTALSVTVCRLRSAMSWLSWL